MPVYLVAEVKVTDDNWIPDYAAKVHDLVHSHGGKYLSRSANVTAIEDDPPDVTMVALIEFPSSDALNGFISDPQYEPYQAARRAGSTGRFYAIDSSDAAGTIPYLAAGGKA